MTDRAALRYAVFNIANIYACKLDLNSKAEILLISRVIKFLEVTHTFENILKIVYGGNIITRQYIIGGFLLFRKSKNKLTTADTAMKSVSKRGANKEMLTSLGSLRNTWNKNNCGVLKQL